MRRKSAMYNLNAKMLNALIAKCNCAATPRATLAPTDGKAILPCIFILFNSVNIALLMEYNVIMDIFLKRKKARTRFFSF